MAATKSKTIDPWKLKKWYPIIAPSYLKGAFIGETPAEAPEKVVNRTVKISMTAVTGEIKKQNTNVTFKVTNFEGNNAVTQIIKIEISPSYIKRNVRKEKTRIDDSFIVKTSDNIDVRIKPFIITKNKINNSKATLLRKLAKMEIKEYVSKVPCTQLIQDLLSFKLQKIMSEGLRKTCPVKNFEIRVFELIESEETQKTEEKKAEAAA